nr:DPP IV N-terminal domain-containing protein [Gracilimonas sp.]
MWVMDVDGNNQTNLTNEPSTDIDHRWSPDGMQIAFENFRTFDNEIWVMDADGSHLTNLTDDPGADTSPSWRPEE